VRLSSYLRRDEAEAAERRDAAKFGRNDPKFGHNDPKFGQSDPEKRI